MDIDWMEAVPIKYYLLRTLESAFSLPQPTLMKSKSGQELVKFSANLYMRSGDEMTFDSFSALAKPERLAKTRTMIVASSSRLS